MNCSIHPVGLHLVHTTISETSSGTQDGSVELHLLRGTARSNRISGTRDGSVWVYKSWVGSDHHVGGIVG